MTNNVAKSALYKESNIIGVIITNLYEKDLDFCIGEKICLGVGNSLSFRSVKMATVSFAQEGFSALFHKRINLERLKISAK